MQKLHESERKLTAKARDQRGHLERVGPLNWEDRVGKWGGAGREAERRVRGSMGLIKGLETRVGVVSVHGY